MPVNRTSPSLGSCTIVIAAVFAAACGQPPATEQGTAAGQTPRTAAAAPAPSAGEATAAADEQTERNANAIAALEKMGAYLRGLKAFQVRSETTQDEVLVDGQTIAFSSVVDLLAQRGPDRLRAEVAGDKQQRFYFYDGQSFTLWAKRANYYATVPAPPTIAALIDRLDDKYDLQLPLVDLFRWGSDRSDTASITAATDAGASEVDGVTCQHYAFRQEGVDWQIWIQLGQHPLPRRLVITTTTDDARPQYGSVMHWNLAPSYDDAAFTFDPPKDTQKIVFAERASGSGQ
jgi:hypothetical protein